MNDGTTSGSGSTARHRRAAGTSVRIVSHAAPVPTTAVATATDAPSRTELPSGRSDACAGSAPPASARATSHVSGTPNSAATAPAASRNSGEGRVPGRARTHAGRPGPSPPPSRVVVSAGDATAVDQLLRALEAGAQRVDIERRWLQLVLRLQPLGGREHLA